MPAIFYKINNKSRFPLETARGCESERFEKSRQLSKQLLRELETSDTYTDEFILSSISKVISPYNLSVKIIKNTLNTRGGHRSELSIVKANQNEIVTEISGHLICLDENVQKRDKYTILHEAGHLFDSAMNPKSLSPRYLKLFDEKEICDTLDKIKNGFFFISNFKEFKQETNALFETIPDEFAIDALKNIRFRLKTEINQYRLGLKMMLKDKNTTLESFLNELILYLKLKFSKKLKFADKLLKTRLNTLARG